MRRVFYAVLGMILLGSGFCCNPAAADEQIGIPVLAYHRFGPTVADSMTVTTALFESQIKWLVANRYTVIPLQTLVDYVSGKGPAPAPKSVVITVDDGHRTVYTEMLPVVLKYRIPITLFIYPSAISNASYAMTWEQLNELRQTGLFDVQSHTFWHPNFKQEKRKLSPEDYQKLVDTQLQRSKAVLEKKLGGRVDFLAWPFGIYDDRLGKEAEKASYVAAFTIDRRHATPSDAPMALPRYLMANSDGLKGFEAIVTGRAAEKKPAR